MNSFMNEEKRFKKQKKMIKNSVLNKLGQANNLGLKKSRAVQGWCAQQGTSLGRWCLFGAGHLARPSHIWLVQSNWPHPYRTHSSTGLQQKPDVQTRATEILWKNKVLWKLWKVEFKGVSSRSEKGQWYFASSKKLSCCAWDPLHGYPSEASGKYRRVGLNDIVLAI